MPNSHISFYIPFKPTCFNSKPNLTYVHIISCRTPHRNLLVPYSYPITCRPAHSPSLIAVGVSFNIWLKNCLFTNIADSNYSFKLSTPTTVIMKYIIKIFKTIHWVKCKLTKKIIASSKQFYLLEWEWGVWIPPTPVFTSSI